MLLFLITSILIIFFFLLKRHYSYWEKLGVPGPKPTFFVGNIWKCFTGQQSFGEFIADLYKKYEDEPFIGMYRGLTPCLVVRDLEFIRNLTSKDFKCFQNNDIAIYKDIDPVLGRHPTLLKGEEWKKSRSQLIPFFTSMKIKPMFNLIEEVSNKMIKYVESNSHASHSAELESKDLCSLFTLENVAVCAFGLESKCFDNPQCEFQYIARKFASPDTWMSMKVFLTGLIPKKYNLLKLKFMTKEVEDRITRIVRENIKYRKEHNIDRKDFFQSICELSENEAKPSDVEIKIVSIVASFFFDGYETSSQSMSFILHLLALHPEAQKKLRDEINSSFVKNNNQFTFESVQEMRYLDACCNEALRIYPGVLYLSKLCNTRYEYKADSDYKNKSVTLEPDTAVIIPVGGLQMDSKYYESPEEFIPERFLDKENIKRYTYLPFGEGPRACIGQRFGLMQIKIGIIHLLKNFEIKPSSKTKMPLKFDPFYINLSPVGGVWLNFHKI